MNITAKEVAALRDMTGAGMMDCKKALVEAEGNMDKAVEILREKGIAKAAKKEGRIAAEGIVGALVEGNCWLCWFVRLFCSSFFVGFYDILNKFMTYNVFFGKTYNSYIIYIFKN